MFWFQREAKMFEKLTRYWPNFDEKLFNINALDYFIATLVFVTVWVVMAGIKRYGLGRNSKILSYANPKLQKIYVNLIEGIHPIIFPMIAFHLAAQKLGVSGKSEKIIGGIVLVAVILQITILVVRLVSFLVMEASFGRDPNDLSVQNIRLNLRAIAISLIWVASVLFTLSNLGVNVTAFITGLGIGGIAIALAAQNILGDVIASFTIALDKPFEIGDFIVIDSLKGTVERIGLKTTRVRSLSGELLVIPNAELTKARINNFQKMERRRIAFNIGVTYQTPTDELRKLPELVKSVVESFPNTTFDRASFLEFGDSALNFEIVFFVQSKDYNIYAETHAKINTLLMDEFAKRKIEFAYPTQTLFMEKGATWP